MSLRSKVEAEIKQAMLNKDKDRLRALRAIKSSILLAQSEKGKSEEISEDTEIKLLTKAAKQRRDSLQVYRDQSREDLAEVEEKELAVIEEFLPKQLSEKELKAELSDIIKSVGASGPQDMGKVMGTATKQLAGRADGKAISTHVKALLSS